MKMWRSTKDEVSGGLEGTRFACEHQLGAVAVDDQIMRFL
jgi:hypothetical protein